MPSRLTVSVCFFHERPVDTCQTLAHRRGDPSAANDHTIRTQIAGTDRDFVGGMDLDSEHSTVSDVAGCAHRYLGAAGRPPRRVHRPAGIPHRLTISPIIHPWTRWFRQARPAGRQPVVSPAMRVRRPGPARSAFVIHGPATTPV